MPRLYSYRERLYSDLYDAVSPRAFDRNTDGRGVVLKMFSNENIGNVALTNLQTAGQLPDMAMAVYSWYARTNISEIGGTDAFKRAWHAWVNATTVDFIVGARPYGVRSLASLLMGRVPFESTPDAAATDRIAKHAWAAFSSEISVATNGDRDGTAAWEEAAWRLLSPQERHAWFKAATAKDPRNAVIHMPRRTSFGVTVTSDPSALRALLEVMPTDAAPQALVWVHLEGWTTRDIQ
jgi:hypothetical protein